MRMKVSRSIRTKLIWATLPTLILTILTISFTNIITFKSLIPLYENLVVARGGAIANNIRGAIHKNLDHYALEKFHWMDAYLDGIVENTDGLIYTFVADTHWKILYHNASNPGATLDNTPYRQLDFSDSTSKLTVKHDDHIELITPIFKSDQIIGSLHMGMENRLINAKLSSMVYRTIAVLAIAVGLFTPLTFFLLKKSIVLPMRTLAAKAQEISVNRDLSQRIQINSADEIGLFASSFNTMIESLQGYYEELQYKNKKIEATQHRLAELNRNLEKKVEARTRQIQNFNTQLQDEIKERKNIELELVKAKKDAEAASASKSNFLANMSHEIRTPMNGIIGMINFLLDSKLTAEQNEYARIVADSAENLLTIINDILDFSKIEAGKLDFEIIDFNLHNTIEEVIKILAFKAHDKKIDLSYNIDPDVPSLIQGDPGRLRQIITNLVNNAIKFTEAGEVTLKLSMPNKQDDGVQIRFEVKDTGIGIPKDRMNRLFKSFSQVDTSTTRRYGGTGLGLVITKRLTEMMGGRMGVKSEIGNGSIFWFTAMFQRQIVSEEKIAKMPANIGGKQVLIVDHNPNDRNLFTNCLESWGCTCRTVGNATEALQRLRRAASDQVPYDLVIIDQMIPDRGGEALGTAIKSSPRLSATLMVLVAASGMRGDAFRIRKIGFHAYMHKPVDPSTTFDCLAAVLGAPAGKENERRSSLVTRHALKDAHRHKPRILLAEDNLINQKVALKMLQKFDYLAETAVNGQEAVSLLRAEYFDLVLMDIQMPEMDGYEATEMIRDPDSGVIDPKIPIIAMTANAMKGDRKKCMKAGMSDYISKPVNSDELLQKLQKWVFPDHRQNGQNQRQT